MVSVRSRGSEPRVNLVLTSIRVGAAAAAASGAVQTSRGAVVAGGTEVTAGGSVRSLEPASGAAGAC